MTTVVSPGLDACCPSALGADTCVGMMLVMCAVLIVVTFMALALSTATKKAVCYTLVCEQRVTPHTCCHLCNELIRKLS